MSRASDVQERGSAGDPALSERRSESKRRIDAKPAAVQAGYRAAMHERSEVPSAARLPAPASGLELQRVSPSNVSVDTVEHVPRGSDLLDGARVDDLLVEEPSVSQLQYV
jgi:hypothetical protein